MELIIVSSGFQALLLLQDLFTGIGLKAIDSSKKVLKITGPALIRSNSVIIGGEKYTPKLFSARKSQVPQQAKKRLGIYPKARFQGKRRKIHIHQRGFKVFVGDPFAECWCIDFGLLAYPPS